jgi:hypothetical protein
MTIYFAESHRQQLDGTIHSAMYHASLGIAGTVRSLPIEDASNE